MDNQHMMNELMVQKTIQDVTFELKQDYLGQVIAVAVGVAQIRNKLEELARELIKTDTAIGWGGTAGNPLYPRCFRAPATELHPRPSLQPVGWRLRRRLRPRPRQAGQVLWLRRSIGLRRSPIRGEAAGADRRGAIPLPPRRALDRRRACGPRRLRPAAGSAAPSI